MKLILFEIYLYFKITVFYIKTKYIQVSPNLRSYKNLTIVCLIHVLNSLIEWQHSFISRFHNRNFGMQDCDTKLCNKRWGNFCASKSMIKITKMVTLYIIKKELNDSMVGLGDGVKKSIDELTSIKQQKNDTNWLL